MTDTPMKWAVIGLGGSGKGHAARLGSIPELALAGAYDPVPTARDEFQASFGVEPTQDLGELLSQADIVGVTVATSSLQHAEVALKAIAAGKHVLVEKPFGMSAAEVSRVLAAADPAGVVAAPFHNRRFDPDFLLVREAISSRRLGRIRRIHSYVGGPSPSTGWRTSKSQAGGRLFDWGPHLLDQVLSLSPGCPETVWGTMHVLPERGDADEYFRADLRIPGGPDVTVEMSGFSYLPPLRWEILGDLGTLQLTGNIHGEFQVSVQTVDGPADVIRTTAAEEQKKRGDGSILIYQQLCDRIEGRAGLTVTGADALNVAKVMDAIRASAKSGTSIHIDA